jgi:acyl-CoA-binding protein
MESNMSLQESFKKFQTREVAIWALSIGASICSLFIANSLYKYRAKRRLASDNDRNRTLNNDRRNIHASIQSSRSHLVSPTLWIQFEDAAALRRCNEVYNKRLTNGDKLILYALYKQIVDGNAPLKMMQSKRINNWNYMTEKAKYDAWNRMRDIPINTAIEQYVTAVTYFCSTASLQSQPVKSEMYNREDFEDEDDDTITSHSDMDEVMETMFAPAAVSRPGIENGGNSVDDSEQDLQSINSLDVRLLHAAGHNDIVSVQRLLIRVDTDDHTTIDVNYADETGQTALHLAADKGNMDIVQLLIEMGANVNACDQDGISVLQAAVIAGHVQTCQLLLQSGANPNQPDHDGDTPRSCCMDDLENIDMIALFDTY